MIIHCSQIYAGLRRDGAQRCRFDALVGEESLRGIEDSVLCIHTFVSIIRMKQWLSRSLEADFGQDDAQLAAI